MENYSKKKKAGIIILIFSITIIGFFLLNRIKNNIKPRLSPYPHGKNFAFTISADPDVNTLEKDKIIYEFFTQVGLKTTIAVWVKDSARSTGIPDEPEPMNNGDSCENPEYQKYIQELKERGFEIALHTVSSGNDLREETIEGYETFKKYFGIYPKINIMHSTNLENVYWGKKVVGNNALQWLINQFVNRGNIPYSGEIEQNKYFWGDILKKNTKYVRLWGTTDINTLKFNPSMPYHDPQKPYVNYWFSFSDGMDVEIFNELISNENIQRLNEERGTSIVYAHFYGFISDGKLNEEFKQRIKTLTNQKDGWFVPATTILDRLLTMKMVRLAQNNNTIYITNLNSYSVEGVTLLVQANEVLYNENGLALNANEEGEIVLNDLKPGETKILIKNRNIMNPESEYPHMLEKINMIFQRSLIYIKHNF